jgi:hypothetical protein
MLQNLKRGRRVPSATVLSIFEPQQVSLCDEIVEELTGMGEIASV